MRKYFLSLVAMAAMILFSGCNKNEDFYISENGDMVTFNIATPEMGTRAISDGTTVSKLYVAVYQGGVYRPALTESDGYDINNKTATVSLPLVTGVTYDIVFWAEAADSPYTFDAENGVVNVQYSGVKANNENLDAFYANRLGYTVEGPKTETVKLTRPFAQLNVATLDYESAANSGINITQTAIKVEGVYTSFNLLNVYGEVTGAPVDIELDPNTIPSETLVVNGTSYKWLSMNYLLVNEKTTISATMTTNNGNVTREWNHIPVQRNFRTNILGNILTTTTDFNVVIDERFTGEEVYPDTDLENLYNAASNGGEVTLTDNVQLTEPLIIKKYVKLNLGGNTITGGKDYVQGMTGIDIAAITVDGGNLIIEGEGSIIGSEYGVYAKNEGTLTVKGGELKGKTSAIQIAEANVNIEGGKFSNTNNSDRRYVINCLDAYWDNGTAKVNITGGSFYMFDPSNNAAEGAGTNFVAEGYKAIPNNNWYIVVPNEIDDVATTDEDLKEALKSSDKVYVVEGDYNTFPASSIKEGQTIICEEGTVFEGKSSLNIKGSTVIGATFKNENDVAVAGTIHGTFKNCEFIGSEALRWCYSEPGKTVIFEECTIKTDFRGFHFDDMKGDVIFRGCEIAGFNAFGGEGTITFEDCTFTNDESSYNGLNIYTNTNIKDCTFKFISGKTNFIDMEGTGKTLTIENSSATLDGNTANIANFVGGSKLGQNTVIYK